MLTMQHRTFLQQSLAASIIYAPSMVAAALLVNLNEDWNYGDRVVFNNLEFNVNIVTALIMGFISIGLAWYIKIVNGSEVGHPAEKELPVLPKDIPTQCGNEAEIGKHGEHYSRSDRTIRAYKKPFLQVLRATILLLMTVVPFVIVNFMTHHDSRQDMVYVSIVNGNSTRTIQV